MKYMLLIHQGTTPLPGTPEWDKLSEDEQPEMATTVRVEDSQN
jgi:hypothetical protein